MQEILKLLNNSNICDNYKIIDYKQGANFNYIKLEANLIKGILYIRIYMSEEEYNYSFHWQNENNELIIRWDNSPHHKNIKTFPHHKHIKQKVKPSYEISFEQILNYIENKLDNL
ncbi:MAG: toxin-antitoxin system TumE family protein [archaeon]